MEMDQTIVKAIDSAKEKTNVAWIDDTTYRKVYNACLASEFKDFKHLEEIAKTELEGIIQ
jgi:hypothetical protein